MTCTEATDLIDDLVDGTLGGPDLHELELHLASCPACRDEERLLRELLAQAEALPLEVEPPRDLWPGIAQRIGAEKRFRLLRGPWRVPLGLAAAAAVVVGVSLAWRAAAPPEAPRTAGTGTADPIGQVIPAAAGTFSPELLAAEQEYARATTALLAALTQRRDRLSPETLASVEENLRVIDVALAQVRTALREDPDNPQLTRLLTSTHRRKVQTLQQVVRLTQES